MNYLKWIGLLVFCSLSVTAWAWPAAVSEHLLAGDNSSKITALELLQFDTDPQGLKLMQHWQQGELFSDGRELLIATSAGYHNFQGTLVVSPNAEKVKLNNRLRQKLEQVLAWRQLAAADAQTRLAALNQLSESLTESDLPLLTARLALETDRQVQTQLQLFIARQQIVSTDRSTRLSALRSLANSDSSQVKDLLASRVPLETDPELKLAALKSQKTIEQKLLVGEALSNVFMGLSLGSILLLAALGLAITYGLLGVINMAHGELLMIGAYATYVVQNLFKTCWPNAFDYYLLAALPVAFISAALVGLLMERLVIRHLYGRPLETLLATWGCSLLLMQTVRMIFGAQNVGVENASWLSGNLQLMSNLSLPFNRMIIIGFALAVLFLVWLLLTKTRLGLFVRAVTQNRRMAACVGVATAKIDALAFGLGSGIAGLAGCALSQIGNVGPDLGQNYIIDSFMVVVLGGVGQLAGTVYAGLGLGIFSKFLEPSVGAVLAKIAMLAVIILFIQKRPQGLFALKGRVQEN
jgi:urea transport system permease protein